MPEDSFWLELLSNRLVSSIALVAILITLRILAVRVIREKRFCPITGAPGWPGSATLPSSLRYLAWR